MDWSAHPSSAFSHNHYLFPTPTYKMKKVKHSETTSTIFFENNEEMENFKKELLKQGGIKFNPDDV